MVNKSKEINKLRLFSIMAVLVLTMSVVFSGCGNSPATDPTGSETGTTSDIENTDNSDSDSGTVSTEDGVTGDSNNGTTAGDKNGATTAKNGTATTAKNNSSKDTGTTVKSSQITNLNGREIRLFSYGYSEKWATETEVGRLYKKQLVAAEKKYNCKIKVLAGPQDTDFDPIFTSILAGDPIVDIVNTGGPHTLIKPITTGLYVDLNQFDVFNWKESKWDREIMKVANFNNKQYVVFVAYEGDSESLMNHAMFFNKRLVKNAGYNPDDIYKWQKAGTWTWSKFEEIAAKISKLDPGKIYGTAGNGKVLYTDLVVSNGTDFIVRNGSELIFNGGDARVLEATEFYKSLAQKGIMSDDDSSANLNQFVAGKIGFISDVLERLQYQDTFGKIKDDYGVVMVPKGPKASDYKSVVDWYGGYAIPTGLKKTEEVAVIVNAISNSAYDSKAAANRAATVAQETYVRDEESLAVFDMVKTRTVLSHEWLSGTVRQDWFAVVDDIVKGKITAADAVSKNKDAYNLTIKNSWTFKTK